MAIVNNPTGAALLVPSLDNLRLEPGDNTVTDGQAAALAGHPVVNVVDESVAAKKTKPAVPAVEAPASTEKEK